MLRFTATCSHRSLPRVAKLFIAPIKLKAIRNGLRILLTHNYSSLKEITDADMSNVPADARGVDTLDRALCSLGVFTRTPKRGTTRKSRLERLSPDQMLRIARVPERFRAVTTLYLENYTTRISDTYTSQPSNARSQR